MHFALFYSTIDMTKNARIVQTLMKCKIFFFYFLRREVKDTKNCINPFHVTLEDLDKDYAMHG